MSRRLKDNTYSQKADRVRGSLFRHKDERHVCYVGSVITPLGIVDASTWIGLAAGTEDATYLAFVWRGREYRRTIRRGTSERGLVILAGRFAREIAGGAR
jgi:hypothetical protein